jgi:hypothetical protein
MKKWRLRSRKPRLTAVGIRSADPQRLALTSPTSGGRLRSTCKTWSNVKERKHRQGYLRMFGPTGEELTAKMCAGEGSFIIIMELSTANIYTNTNTDC